MLNPYERPRFAEDHLATKIKDEFKPEAIEITELLDNNPMCIVIGPTRIGKSAFLFPALQDELASKGKLATVIRSQDEVNDEENDDEASRVFIWDEAQLPIVLNQNTSKGKIMRGKSIQLLAEYIQKSHMRNARLITVLPYFTSGTMNSLPFIRDVATLWQRAEEKISGSKVPIIELPHKRLSLELAREYLLDRSQRVGNNLSADVVEYLLTVLPYHIHVLDMISRDPDINSVRWARFKIPYYLKEHWQITLPSEEIVAIRENLRNA